MFMLLLMKKYILMLIGILVVAGAGFVAHQKISEATSLKKLLADKAQELLLEKANVQQLTNAIEAQKKAINDLKVKADAHIAAAQEDLKNAQNKANKVKDKAESIYNAKPTKGTDCDSANQLINKLLK